MKNSVTTVLICITLAFATFVAGFYFGKNTSVSTIEISGHVSTKPSNPTSASTPDRSKNSGLSGRNRSIRSCGRIIGCQRYWRENT